MNSETEGDAAWTGVPGIAEISDRLRRMPESRLRRVAEAAHAFAQDLADAASGVEGRTAADPPPHRVVPSLSVFAVADQVTVTAHDLDAAAAGLAPATEVWWQGARRPLGDVRAVLADRARNLRAQV